MWLGYGGAWPDDAPVEGRAPSRAAVEHRQRCLALGVAARLGQLDVQHQAVAVLGEQMAQVAELRRLPRPLRVQLRLRVGAGGVCLPPPQAPEVDLRVAPASACGLRESSPR